MLHSRQIRYLVLGTVISALVVWFIGTQIQLELLLIAFQNVRFEAVLLCVLFLTLGLVARGWRWRSLLNAPIDYWRTFHIMNIAYMINGVLPFRLGEVARLYLISRPMPDSGFVPAPQALGSILIERIFDLFAVVLMVLIALVIAPVPQDLRIASVVGTIGAVVSFTLLVLFARHKMLAQQIIALLVRRFPILERFHLAPLITQFLEGLVLLTQGRILFGAIVWSVVGWGLSIVGGYLLMYALFEQANWGATLLYIAAAAFAIAVPAVPGNLGTYEGSILLALTALGYQNTEQTIAFAILVHAVNVLVHAFTGAIGLLREGISLSQLSAEIRHSSPAQTTE